MAQTENLLPNGPFFYDKINRIWQTRLLTEFGELGIW